MDFEIISQECSFGDPLLKLLKLFHSDEKMATKVKNRKTF